MSRLTPEWLRKHTEVDKTYRAVFGGIAIVMGTTLAVTWWAEGAPSEHAGWGGALVATVVHAWFRGMVNEGEIERLRNYVLNQQEDEE